MLGLNEIEGNVAEGVVLKFLEYVIKIKSLKFLEMFNENENENEDEE